MANNRFHATFNYTLQQVITTPLISSLPYTGYVTPTNNSFYLINYTLDPNNNLIINSTDGYLTNIGIPASSSDPTVASFWVTTKASQYNIITQFDNSTNTNTVYDQMGKVICTSISPNQITKVVDFFNYNTNQNIVILLNSSGNTVFTFLLDFNSNIIAIADAINNFITLNPPYNFSIQKIPNKDLLTSPIIFTPLLVHSTFLGINNLPVFSIGSTTITTSLVSGLYVLSYVDNSATQILTTINNIYLGVDMELIFFQVSRMDAFIYVLFNRSADILYTFNYRNQLIGSIQTNMIYNFIVDVISNTVYYYYSLENNVLLATMINEDFTINFNLVTSNNNAITNIVANPSSNGLTVNTAENISTITSIPAFNELVFSSESMNTVFAAPNGSTGIPTFRSLVGQDIFPILHSTSSDLTITQSGDIVQFNLISGIGTVSSVAMVVPNFLNVSGSPITTSGVFDVTLISEPMNTVFAAPTGSIGTPTFRSLVSQDIPPINLASSGNGGVTGILPVANGGTGTSEIGTGVVTLVAGVAVVLNSSVTAVSRIFLTCQVPGGTPAFLYVYSRTPGVSFTIYSGSTLDTSLVAFEIFEPS